MRKPPWILAILVVAGCASSDVTVLQKAPAKQTPCDIERFRDGEIPWRNYEKLCVISVDERPITTNAYDANANARALGKIEDEACRCGADAVIVHQLGRGSFRATAIRRLPDQKF